MTQRERGQTTLLTLGYVVVALLLVTVVVNLSRVFLAQRALDSAADEAAIAAVQAVRTDPYYGDGIGDRLPLSASGARDAVVRHLRATDADEACESFAVDAVDTTATTVTVTVSCRVSIPFVNVVSGSYSGGVPITGTATARQSVRP